MTDRPRRMTPAQAERCADLRERGWTFAAIAADIGFTISAVRWVCLRDGAEPPKPTALRPIPDKPAIFQRGDRAVRRFTSAEDARLLAMRQQGHTSYQIGAALGRKNHTILGRLATLARHAERSESQS